MLNCRVESNLCLTDSSTCLDEHCKIEFIRTGQDSLFILIKYGNSLDISQLCQLRQPVETMGIISSHLGFLSSIKFCTFTVLIFKTRMLLVPESYQHQTNDSSCTKLICCVLIIFQTIQTFRDEELEHLHIGEEHDAEKVSKLQTVWIGICLFL